MSKNSGDEGCIFLILSAAVAMAAAVVVYIYSVVGPTIFVGGIVAIAVLIGLVVSDRSKQTQLRHMKLAQEHQEQQDQKQILQEQERLRQEQVRERERLRYKQESLWQDRLQEQERVRKDQQQLLLFERREHIIKSQVAIIHLGKELGAGVQRLFMIQPCSRCHEFKMSLLAISPNARSVHYQCLNCEKKMHASAATPDASRILETRDELNRQVGECQRETCDFSQNMKSYLFNFGTWVHDAIPSVADLIGNIQFEAPAAPLPFEQTTRSPIPEASRSEVWRRDSGRCVQCGSKQNLQFDHIIPVVLGGATTVANLQLLCQPCNGTKGKKI